IREKPQRYPLNNFAQAGTDALRDAEHAALLILGRSDHQSRSSGGRRKIRSRMSQPGSVHSRVEL
ncbi:MAG: hypothetical protein ACRDRT_15820, partial [Pseudonocardiaceae bacterium]